MSASALHLAAEGRTRALALLDSALRYAETGISDLRGRREAMVHDDFVCVLKFLSDLRDILSPDPAMERPIGDEILREWMR